MQFEVHDRDQIKRVEVIEEKNYVHIEETDPIEEEEILDPKEKKKLEAAKKKAAPPPPKKAEPAKKAPPPKKGATNTVNMDEITIPEPKKCNRAEIGIAEFKVANMLNPFN